MTALNCFLDKNAAHFFTDGAVYDAKTATVQGFMSKVFPLPRYGAAFGVSGNAPVGLLLIGALADTSFRDFDDLADNLAETIGEYVVKSAPTGIQWGTFNVVLAGWSIRDDKPRAVLFSSAARDGNPKNFAKPITRFQSPMVTPAFEFDRENAAKCGARLVNDQRSNKFSPDDPSHGPAGGIYGIGGFLQYTRVSRDGVEIKVLDRWPDKIGEVIDPHATREGWVNLA